MEETRKDQAEVGRSVRGDGEGGEDQEDEGAVEEAGEEEYRDDERGRSEFFFCAGGVVELAFLEES